MATGGELPKPIFGPRQAPYPFADFRLACETEAEFKQLVLNLKKAKDPRDQELAVDLFHILDELFDGCVHFQTMQLMSKEELRKVQGASGGGKKGKKRDAAAATTTTAGTTASTTSGAGAGTGSSSSSSSQPRLADMPVKRSSARVQMMELEKQERDRLQMIVEEEQARERKRQRERNMRKWGQELLNAVQEANASLAASLSKGDDK